MSESVSSNQLTTGLNVVSSPGDGVGEMVMGAIKGVEYRRMLFDTDNENATPSTNYGDESSIAAYFADDDLDDGSVIFAGGGAARGLVRDKMGQGYNDVRDSGVSI